MKKVNLFITCLMDTLFPDAAQAVVDVLEHVGLTVITPKGQTCCGQPAYNGGFWEEAQEMAKYNIDLFAPIEGDIVIPSGSCAAMITKHYPDLLKDDPHYGPKAAALSARVFEFSQYLVDHIKTPDIGAACSARVVYHPSCHSLRGMGIDRQPRELLANVRGLQVLEQENPETCCGFGGVFAVKMPDISGKMLANRLAAFETTGAELVVGCDISCLMHIEGGLRKKGSRMRSKHIAQLLAEGLKS